MHELSLMQGIIETAMMEAKKADAKKVTKLGLKIGERSGVVADALLFAFEALSKDTLMESAILEIESIPLMGECTNCGHQFKAPGGFLICDQCQGFGKPIAGQELNLEYIEVES